MKLFVFDLDFTIWDAGGTWCDCTYPPYQLNDDHIQDGDGRQIKLYRDVLEILNHLDQNNKLISAASRTNAPDIAYKLMSMFEIRDYFDHPQIYPGSKIRHFEILQKKFGIPYHEMVFFDDEYRNIHEVSALGVSCEYLENGGLQWDLVKPYL